MAAIACVTWRQLPAMISSNAVNIYTVFLSVPVPLWTTCTHGSMLNLIESLES